MNTDALKPFGFALLAYHQGAHEAQLIIRRDDGLESALPVSHFFRPEAEFSAIERKAIELCNGRVLDMGAGTGVHSLALQSGGRSVTAIDITREAVRIMRQRGVGNCLQADLFEYRGGPFDTLLMLGHGIGMVEDLAGLHRFLRLANALVHPAGQVLFDSLDVSRSAESKDLEYHEGNRKAGRYMGEITMRFEFQGVQGPSCRWLHVDFATLAQYARKEGWESKQIMENENGEYLARLHRT